MKHSLFDSDEDRRREWKSLLDEAVEYLKTHDDVDDIDDAIQAIIWREPHPEKMQ